MYRGHWMQSLGWDMIAGPWLSLTHQEGNRGSRSNQTQLTGFQNEILKAFYSLKESKKATLASAPIVHQSEWIVMTIQISRQCSKNRISMIGGKLFAAQSSGSRGATQNLKRDWSVWSFRFLFSDCGGQCFNRCDIRSCGVIAWII